MNRYEKFHQQYNLFLETEEDFCYCCTEEIAMKINKRFGELYTSYEVEDFLYGDRELTKEYIEMIW